MGTCQICKRDNVPLRFETGHINICVNCVNALNDSPEPAQDAEQRLGERLKRGILRKANFDLVSDNEAAKAKARNTLANFDAVYERALPGWINRLLAKTSNRTRDFQIMRAYRRGLVQMERGRYGSYPSDWEDRAMRIRQRDQCCRACGDMDAVLDVHHIVYLSNYGTSKQSNLVGLCRSCHEGVHGHAFDLGEADKPVKPPPIRPAPPPTSAVDLLCPGCQARITAKIEVADVRTQRVRCPGCKLIFVAADHPAITPTPPPSTRSITPQPEPMPSAPYIAPPPSPPPRRPSPTHPLPVSPVAQPPTLSASAWQTMGTSQWRGLVPDPTNARGIGWLRSARAVCALLFGCNVFWLLSAITLAGGVTRFFSTASVFGLVVGIAWTCAFWYAFHALRHRINEMHTLGYGYPHPALKRRWAL